MKTLPDYLRSDLRVVSIGLNPSLPSAKAGFYFANPRNRFWRALNDSGLLGSVVVPGVEAMALLLTRDGIGFTDVVKRPTRGGAELRAADFKRGAPEVKEKLVRCAPKVAWFHGKQAYGQYLRYAEGLAKEKPAWGPQALCIGVSRVFVTPNPSPANAAYSLEDLTRWYRRLGRYVSSEA